MVVILRSVMHDDLRGDRVLVGLAPRRWLTDEAELQLSEFRPMTMTRMQTDIG
jgi:hypothetical protein